MGLHLAELTVQQVRAHQNTPVRKKCGEVTLITFEQHFVPLVGVLMSLPTFSEEMSYEATQHDTDEAQAAS